MQSLVKPMLTMRATVSRVEKRYVDGSPVNKTIIVATDLPCLVTLPRLDDGEVYALDTEANQTLEVLSLIELKSGDRLKVTRPANAIGNVTIESASSPVPTPTGISHYISRAIWQG